MKFYYINFTSLANIYIILIPQNIMWFFKKKKEQDKLISGTIRKLNNLEKKKITEKSAGELSDIVRTLLERKYKISRSMTTEEIVKELKNKKIGKKTKLNLGFILLEINKEEYKAEAPSTKSQFDDLIKKTKKIINKI